MVLVNIRRALSRRPVTLAAGALPAGVALLAAGYLLHRPAPAPAPSITPLGACELTVMRRVPVPPPADMTFSSIVTRSAAGGYEITGVVEAYPQTSAPGRWTWTCDAEARPGIGWYAWLVTVTPQG